MSTPFLLKFVLGWERASHRVSGFGLQAAGIGLRVSSFELVSGFGLRASGVGFQISGVGLRGSG